MIFKETNLKGAFIIELEKIVDERGFFSRAWCQKEFEANGLNPNVVQCNLSFNTSKGTLRGMHYQIAPHEEAKILRCIRGQVYDVIIDLRPESSTYLQWLAVELSWNPRYEWSCLLRRLRKQAFSHWAPRQYQESSRTRCGHSMSE